MKIAKGLQFPKWLLLPLLSCSCTVLANGYAYDANPNTSALTLENEQFAQPPSVHSSAATGYQHAVPQAMEQAQAMAENPNLTDAEAMNSANVSYVGGNTRVGIGVDSELKGVAEARHVFSDTKSSVTSGEAWVGFDPEGEDANGEDDFLTGAGVKVNHHWVGKNNAGQVDVVHKVFGAYDTNQAEDHKVSAGYGQETENAFWSVQGSLADGDERVVGTTADGRAINEKPYDYGVGVRAGKFMTDSLLQVQVGADAEWAKDYNEDDEDLPAQISLNAGVEKFFQDSPHSVAANVSAHKKTGGHESDDDDSVETRGNVSYRYEFGGENGLFEPNQTYRRVRVEIPGQTKLVKESKTIPGTPKKRVERKLIKNTMELEGDTFFEVNSHHLTPEAQRRLLTIIARIRQTGHHGNIRITGNTCDVGREDKNQLLSDRRAQSVRDFMVRNGFNPSQLLARGVGEMHPKYPNNDATRHRNRRVDIEYMTYETSYKDTVVDEMSKPRTVTTTRKVQMPPRIVWRKELVQSEPKWVSRALRNTIQHKRYIDTYRTVEAGVVNAPEEGTLIEARDDSYHMYTNSKSTPLGLMANDNFLAGARVEIVSHPSNGTATLASDGTFVNYQPNTGFEGTDSFTYRLIDANGNASDPATVSIHVSSCAGSSSTQCNSMSAVDDVYPIMIGDTLMKTLNVLGNDTGNNLKIVDVSEPKYGSAIISSDGKYVEYTLRHGYCVDHSFTYVVEDEYGNRSSATVSINVVD